MILQPLRMMLALIAFIWALPALAQTFTVPTIGTSGMGNVAAAASGQTIFRADAATSTITKLSGNGVDMAASTMRSLVTVGCGDQKQCNSADALVTITTTGSATGRAAALQNFTVSTSGATATIVLAPGTGSSITFRIGPVGRNSTKTFWVGYDLPINGDDTAGATGNAASSFVVTASRIDGTLASSLSGSATATVFRAISITNTANLAFGRVTLPRSGLATVSLAPATGLVTVTGTGIIAFASPTPSAAAFSVRGEGAQAITVSVPGSFTLTGPAGTLTVTTIPSVSGTQTLSGTLGAAGALTVNVGGSFELSTSTASGTYTGTISVTAQYN